MIALYLSSALIAGACLSWSYFQGLWWTSQFITKVQNPYRLILASFIARSAAVSGIFYLLLVFQWQAFACALAGFVIARLIIVRRLAGIPFSTNQSEVKDGIQHR